MSAHILGVVIVIHELVAILKSFQGPGVKGKGGVWRIDGTSDTAKECKTALLDAICSRVQPFVRYDEPPDFPPLDAARKVGTNTWRLPPRVPGSVLQSWLYMGNWQLYVAAAPIQAIPDLCRSSDTGIERFIEDTGVSVIIDAFHDDVSWVVGLKGEDELPAAGDAPRTGRS